MPLDKPTRAIRPRTVTDRARDHNAPTEKELFHAIALARAAAAAAGAIGRLEQLRVGCVFVALHRVARVSATSEPDRTLIARNHTS